jgi:hypothetical protein
VEPSDTPPTTQTMNAARCSPPSSYRPISLSPYLLISLSQQVTESQIDEEMLQEIQSEILQAHADILLNIDQMLLNIDQILLHIDQMLLHID